MARIPSSTYRLQLHKGFTFDDAAAVADYLQNLGISHVYSSPYLQAAPASTHGYDVVDHTRVNEELGGAEAHDRFCRKLAEAKLGQVLDVVPNHMALGRQNRYWWDVLVNGVSSRYASFFDIDWQPHEERLRNKVLVPILPDQYGKVLRSGGIWGHASTQRSRGYREVPHQPQTKACNPAIRSVGIAEHGFQPAWNSARS
jgi:(1->4)-alpha-D-glucan 1-alpha-D-glucosylmutase